MGEAQRVDQIHRAVVATTAITIGVQPTSADGAAAAAVTLTAAAVAWTWGAWAQIALGAAVLANSQIIGISLENFVGIAAQGEVEIGTGVAPAGAAIARIPITSPYTPIEGGPLVAAGTGIVARYRTATGAADTVGIKLVTKLGVGV